MVRPLLNPLGVSKWYTDMSVAELVIEATEQYAGNPLVHEILNRLIEQERLAYIRKIQTRDEY